MMYRRLILAILLQALAPCVDAHDWYEGLTDSNGSPCCSGRECQPVDYRYSRATGRLEVDLDGTWMEVHPSKIVPSPSIDEKRARMLRPATLSAALRAPLRGPARLVLMASSAVGAQPEAKRLLMRQAVQAFTGPAFSSR